MAHTANDIIRDLMSLSGDIEAQDIETLIAAEQKPRPRGRPKKVRPDNATAASTTDDMMDDASINMNVDAAAPSPSFRINKSLLGIVTAKTITESNNIAAAAVADQGNIIAEKLAVANLSLADPNAQLLANIDIRCQHGHIGSVFLSVIMRDKAKCPTCSTTKAVKTIREQAETVLGVLSLVVGGINSDSSTSRQLVFQSACGRWQIAVGKNSDHGRAEIITAIDDATNTAASTILRVHLRIGRGYVIANIAKAAKDHNRQLPIEPKPVARPGRLPVSSEMANAVSASTPNPLMTKMDMNVIYDSSMCFENNLS